MKTPEEKFDDFRTNIAKDFYAAYLANYRNITFRTARGYVSDEDEIGDLWLFLADLTIASVNEMPADFLADWKEKFEKEEGEPGKVIPFGRVD